MIYDITYIVTAVVELIGAILVVAVVPVLRDYLKQRFDQNELDGLEKAVEIAVQAAEQIYKAVPQSGIQKKNYVLTLLQEKGYTIDTEEVNAMIEAKVIELYGEVIA